MKRKRDVSGDDAKWVQTVRGSAAFTCLQEAGYMAGLVQNVLNVCGERSVLDAALSLAGNDVPVVMPKRGLFMCLGIDTLPATPTGIVHAPPLSLLSSTPERIVPAVPLPRSSPYLQPAVPPGDALTVQRKLLGSLSKGLVEESASVFETPLQDAVRKVVRAVGKARMGVKPSEIVVSLQGLVERCTEVVVAAELDHGVVRGISVHDWLSAVHDVAPIADTALLAFFSTKIYDTTKTTAHAVLLAVLSALPDPLYFRLLIRTLAMMVERSNATLSTQKGLTLKALAAISRNPTGFFEKNVMKIFGAHETKLCIEHALNTQCDLEAAVRLYIQHPVDMGAVFFDEEGRTTEGYRKIEEVFFRGSITATVEGSGVQKLLATLFSETPRGGTSLHAWVRLRKHFRDHPMPASVHIPQLYQTSILPLLKGVAKESTESRVEVATRGMVLFVGCVRYLGKEFLRKVIDNDLTPFLSEVTDVVAAFRVVDGNRFSLPRDAFPVYEEVVEEMRGLHTLDILSAFACQVVREAGVAGFPIDTEFASIRANLISAVTTLRSAITSRPQSAFNIYPKEDHFFSALLSESGKQKTLFALSQFLGEGVLLGSSHLRRWRKWELEGSLGGVKQRGGGDVSVDVLCGVVLLLHDVAECYVNDVVTEEVLKKITNDMVVDSSALTMDHIPVEGSLGKGQEGVEKDILCVFQSVFLAVAGLSFLSKEHLVKSAQGVSLLHAGLHCQAKNGNTKAATLRSFVARHKYMVE